MNKSLYFFINVLIYWVVVTAIDGLNAGTFGTLTALILGGLLFALVSFAAEPVLGFFKFPENFWGLLVVGFVLNLLLFIILSTGILSPILKISAGSIGGGFDPLPIPVVTLGSAVVVASVGAVVATLLQILARRLGN
jgi:hypothetical protein